MRQFGYPLSTQNDQEKRSEKLWRETRTAGAGAGMVSLVDTVSVTRLRYDEDHETYEGYNPSMGWGRLASESDGAELFIALVHLIAKLYGYVEKLCELMRTGASEAGPIIGRNKQHIRVHMYAEYTYVPDGSSVPGSETFRSLGDPTGRSSLRRVAPHGKTMGASGTTWSSRQRAHRCRPRIFHISQDLADAGRASNFGTPIPAPLAQGRLALDPDQRALPV
jgi:hypothetical protein